MKVDDEPAIRIALPATQSGGMAAAVQIAPFGAKTPRDPSRSPLAASRSPVRASAP
jgi:hypothetical protein